MPLDTHHSAPSDNPMTVEVTRGGIVESRHRGAAAVISVSGAVEAAWGDIGRDVYPRSAIKAFQALPGVESGAFDAAGFTAPEISLACSSHNGEADHASTAASMLAKLGLSEADIGVRCPLALSRRKRTRDGGGRRSPDPAS